MGLDSLLAGLMLFSSFAVRTPNVEPNPDDYEFSLGVGHENFYFNRQWERELGEKYIDDLFWIKFDNGYYFKPEYMNKESHEIKYAKIDWRRSFRGVSVGATTRSTNDELNEYETFASLGWDTKKTYWDELIEVEFSVDGYLPPDENGESSVENLEYENEFKISWKLTDRVRLYNLGEIAKLKGREHYRGKVGVEVSF